MSVDTTRGYTTPSLTVDSPDIPAWMRTLALDIDADVSAVEAAAAAATALKANTAGPTFTGDPKAPTPSAGDNDTSLATTAFVRGAAWPAGLSPYFRAYRNSAYSGVGNNVTAIFDAEADPNGWYATATGIFLPTVAGMYRVSWAVQLNAGLTVGNYLRSYLKKNGVTYAAGTLFFQSTSTPGGQTTGTTLVAMNGTTDTVEVQIMHNNSTIDIVGNGNPGYTHFEAEYVGS